MSKPASGTPQPTGPLEPPVVDSQIARPGPEGAGALLTESSVSELATPPVVSSPQAGRLSYRERKAESDAIARLARSLVELGPAALSDVPLPDEVCTEIERCRGFRKGARIRQLRRISQMLRRLNVEEVQAAADDAGHRRRGRAGREQIYEHWRQRLVAEGDRALTEFVLQYPQADRQRLRQLLRQAGREPEHPKSKRALREVLRVIRRACEADGSGSSSNIGT